MRESTSVEFRNVSKGFQDRKVLDNVSFKLPESKTLCVLGKSGTGKSVTLKLLIGLLKPDSGNICIGSDDIGGMSDEELSHVRRHMGFLFQSAALFDSFTVGDNLALPFQRFHPDKRSSDIKREVLETLKQVGLEKDLNKLPGELSGGMKKRAGLARALILKPKLLLVDEPSSGLDRITAAEIDSLLLHIKKEDKTTMVIVTHDVHSARRLADLVAVLDQGSLAAFGPVEEVQKSENEVVRDLITESEI